MMDVMEGLYQVVQERKEEKREGSYTCYLFEQGLDKILKKCGEECSEVIIAAKNGKNEDTANEICDLIYHLLVMMVESGIPLEDVEKILAERRQTYTKDFTDHFKGDSCDSSGSSFYSDSLCTVLSKNFRNRGFFCLHTILSSSIFGSIDGNFPSDSGKRPWRCCYCSDNLCGRRPDLCSCCRRRSGNGSPGGSLQLDMAVLYGEF